MKQMPSIAKEFRSSTYAATASQATIRSQSTHMQALKSAPMACQAVISLRAIERQALSHSMPSAGLSARAYLLGCVSSG